MRVSPPYPAHVLPGPLVEVDWLLERLGSPDLVVVDCRFRLGDPEAGQRLYEDEHVAGARFLDVDRDLSDPPGPGGRHPLPATERFEAAARRIGIGAGVTVVAYDEAGESGAARLWWLLRHFGHDPVAVLDGGLRAWREGGGPMARGPEPDAIADRPGRFVARPRADDVITADELRDQLELGRLELLDARAPERFRGEVEPIDPVAGHIPGARNLPAAELLHDGRLLRPDELRSRFGAPGPGDGGLVASCGSGLTACTVLLAADVAGLPPARLYPGSWSEWSSLGLPVAREPA